MIDQAARLRTLFKTKDEPEEKIKAPSLFEPVEGEKAARVIAVTSGKGGVGKTSLTVNLAIALQDLGKRVIIVDADLGMANVDVVLGIMSRYHLLRLLEESITLDDVIVQGPHGIQYIPGGSGIEKARTLSEQDRFILQSKLSECNRRADIILVDTSAGIGRNVMEFILASDEVLLVTTPEPTSLTDAYAVMKAYSLYSETKNIRLVVNRVDNEEESREVANKLNQTSKKFLQMSIDCIGYIFEDKKVTMSIRKQAPFIIDEPKSMASQCVRSLAKSILSGKPSELKLGWTGFLKKVFRFG
ncbi:MAG: MinD/ParA family protein [Selenomonadaceae bacterium]|nr:MinD/ParA family protein [Selenomonadaceae bacterium]